MPTADDARPLVSHRYLVPVLSLGVPAPWNVGSVTLHPGQAGPDLIAATPPNDANADAVHDILASANEHCIAEVDAASDLEAFDQVRAALDVLRVFLLATTSFRTAHFGMPDEMPSGAVEYIVSDGERCAWGGRYLGQFSGFTFGAQSLTDWQASRAFQFGAAALSNRTSSEGARRAAVGLQLLGRAILEHRTDLKMLGVVAALEAWLLQRDQRGAQTMKLARHVSWFGCGRHNDSLCGRSRPICPYLRLDPDKGRDRNRLGTLRRLGNESTAWRCAEWLRVMDWYDARSGAAHGDPSAVDKHTADQAEYWAAHNLTEPILEWLADHPDDPVGDLSAAVEAIDAPDLWHDMLRALDSSNPPEMPPVAS